VCSTGDAFQVELSGESSFADYKCLDCGKAFKGLGKNLVCPACKSSNIKLSK
jgi:Zn finger protein HypA/HybF involved in hydrogenase expression